MDYTQYYVYRDRPIPGKHLREAIIAAIRTFKEAPTRREICKRMKRSKSPHIINEIRDMVREGVLIEHEIPFGGAFAFVYKVSEKNEKV